jgi:hypothetical protein
MAHISVVYKEDRGEEVCEEKIGKEKGFQELCQYFLEGKILFQ